MNNFLASYHWQREGTVGVR